MLEGVVCVSMRSLALAFARSTATPGVGWCGACVEVLAVTGAGITLMGGDQTGPLCVTSERVRVLEEVQFTTGVGPCRDAFAARAPVLTARFTADPYERWPEFVAVAVACGIGAVFAYPLSAHGVTVGVLTLYQDAAGPLSSVQHDDSIALSEILSETMLSLQGDAPDATLAPGLDDAVAYRAQIHQASGMIAVQLLVSPGEALARLRAHAFAHDLPPAAVAAEIVAGRLCLDDDRGPSTERS